MADTDATRALLAGLLERHSREVARHFSKEIKSLPSRELSGSESALRSKLYACEFAGPSSAPSAAARQTDRPEKRVKTSRADDLALVAVEIEKQKAEEALPQVSRALQVRRAAEPEVEAMQHRQWKLARVIPGHRGVPKAIAVDFSNRVFATGGMDNVIKVFDVASGKLQMNFESHTHPVRGLAFSPRHAYLFSVGEDKAVKAWDLELNQIVRQYHGHTSGVYCVAVHPTLDLVITAGRDATCRVWDMRTRHQVHALTGHKEAIMSLGAQSLDPQIVTGSEDGTVRLWDLAAGRASATLTHHKKGVRALMVHPNEFSFATASTGSVKKFAFPDGRLMQNFQFEENEPRTIIHSLRCSPAGQMIAAGTDDGYLKFWDWTSAKTFQRLKIKTMPGTLESEAGVMALAFDMTGERLFGCIGDKTIQMFKPVEGT